MFCTPPLSLFSITPPPISLTHYHHTGGLRSVSLRPAGRRSDPGGGGRCSGSVQRQVSYEREQVAPPPPHPPPPTTFNSVNVLCCSYGRVYTADPYHAALAPAAAAAAYGVGAMVRT